jgi:hypothetical protein
MMIAIQMDYQLIFLLIKGRVGWPNTERKDKWIL